MDSKIEDSYEFAQKKKRHWENKGLPQIFQ